MTRLSSNYSIYAPILLLPIALVAIPAEIYTNAPGLPWYNLLFAAPIFALWGYYIYRSRRVYYNDGLVYLAGPFSSELTVIRKDRFGSIDKISWLESSSTGNYKLTYYDDDNNVKYVRFTLNISLSDGKEIIDKLNEID